MVKIGAFTKLILFSIYETFNTKILSPGIVLKLQVNSQSISKQYYFLVFACFTIYFNVCFLFLVEYLV